MKKEIKNILVVDDEVEITKTILRHLKREGFQMESSNTVDEARHKIEDASQCGRDFDLVITDLIMPGKSGLELVEWLKCAQPHISILLISGVGDVDLLYGAIRPELDTFCLKPLTPDKIMSLITTIEEQRQANIRQ